MIIGVLSTNPVPAPVPPENPVTFDAVAVAPVATMARMARVCYALRMSDLSLQEKYAPQNACFGCGPANKKGLRIRSFFRGEEYVVEWTPEKHHEAFDGMLNGGIIGTLLDCHMNWAAAHDLMVQSGDATPPCTVTAEFSVKFHRPTPTDGPIRLSARIIESSEDRAVVESILQAKDETCAIGRGRFVAVRPGHPAYHRW